MTSQPILKRIEATQVDFLIRYWPVLRGLLMPRLIRCMIAIHADVCGPRSRIGPTGVGRGLGPLILERQTLAFIVFADP